MPFINERISAADQERYRLDELDKEIFGVIFDAGRIWCVDKISDVYLRPIKSGREESFYMETFMFFWSGHAMKLKIENLEGRGERGGHIWQKKRVVDMAIPDSLEDSRQLIFSDLKKAFLAYKGAGIFSTASSYDLDLEINI